MVTANGPRRHPDDYYCALEGEFHPVPSLARDCERRHLESEYGKSDYAKPLQAGDVGHRHVVLDDPVVGAETLNRATVSGQSL